MTSRGVEKLRSNEDRPTLQCYGCGDLFYASRRDAAYCSTPCRARNRSSYRHHSWPRPCAREVPMDAAMMKFREKLYSLAHQGCVGYRLFSPRLNWWFPIEGNSLRTTGRFSDLPYFSLIRPFERPIVPIDDIYHLVFVEEHGNVVQGIQMTEHYVKASLEMAYIHKQLKERLALYSAEQQYAELGPVKGKPKPRGLLSR